jgi:hypothetical protein
METITIRETSKEAKAIIEMLKSFSFVEFHKPSKINSKTLISLKEAEDGKVIRAKNSKELMKKLLS